VPPEDTGETQSGKRDFRYSLNLRTHNPPHESIILAKKSRSLLDQPHSSGLLRSLDIAGSGSSAAHNLSVYSIPVKVVSRPAGDPNAALRALYLKQIKKFKKKAKDAKKKKKVAAAKKFKKKAKSVSKKLAAL